MESAWAWDKVVEDAAMGERLLEIMMRNCPLTRALFSNWGWSVAIFEISWLQTKAYIRFFSPSFSIDLLYEISNLQHFGTKSEKKNPGKFPEIAWHLFYPSYYVAKTGSLCIRGATGVCSNGCKKAQKWFSDSRGWRRPGRVNGCQKVTGSRSSAPMVGHLEDGAIQIIPLI